jgi:hypothetical protein
LAEAPDLNNRPLKTGFYSVFFSIISNGAVVLCFIPFLFLGWKKMRKIHSYWVLGIYWFLNGADNLLEIYFSRSGGSHVIRQLSFYYSLLEAPLVLLVFALARQGRERKGLLLLLLLFMTGESILLHWSGNSFVTLILGSGLMIVLLCSMVGLWQYLIKMEHTRFENSMVFVYASLLFSYGSMLIIYIFAHLHHNANSNNSESDSFLLYYLSLLLSAAITSAGLWSYGIRKSHQSGYSHPTGYSSSSS